MKGERSECSIQQRPVSLIISVDIDTTKRNPIRLPELFFLFSRKLDGDLALLSIPLITLRPVPPPGDLTPFHFSRFPGHWSPISPPKPCHSLLELHSSFLPQDLCLCCFLCQECSSPCYLTGCFLLILRVSSCMSSPQRSPH